MAGRRCPRASLLPPSASPTDPRCVPRQSRASRAPGSSVPRASRWLRTSAARRCREYRWARLSPESQGPGWRFSPRAGLESQPRQEFLLQRAAANAAAEEQRHGCFHPVTRSQTLTAGLDWPASAPGPSSSSRVAPKAAGEPLPGSPSRRTVTAALPVHARGGSGTARVCSPEQERTAAAGGRRGTSLLLAHCCQRTGASPPRPETLAAHGTPGRQRCSGPRPSPACRSRSNPAENRRPRSRLTSDCALEALPAMHFRPQKPRRT